MAGTGHHQVPNSLDTVAVLVGVVLAGTLTACSSAEPPRASAARPSATQSTPPTPSTSVSVSTPAPVPAAVSGLPVLREFLPPPELEPGRYRTPDSFRPVTTVRVPAGWHGFAEVTGWSVGEGDDPEAQDYARSSIYVFVVPMPLDEAVAAFSRLDGLDVGRSRPVSLGGMDGVAIQARATREGVVLDSLGLPDIDVPMGRRGAETVFIDVRGVTITVGTWSRDRRADHALQRVLASIRFPA